LTLRTGGNVTGASNMTNASTPMTTKSFLYTICCKQMQADTNSRVETN